MVPATLLQQQHPSILSYPVPNPLAPRRASLDDEGSDLSSDTESDIAVYRQRATADDSDERLDELDEKDRLVEEGTQLAGNDHWIARHGARGRRRRILTTILPTALLLILGGTFFLSQLFSAAGRHSFNGSGLKPITLEHVENGTFWPERETLDWLAEAGDGVYSYRTDDGSIVLEDVRTNTTKMLVDGSKVVDSRGARLAWSRFKVSADLKYILFDTEYTKQWRHSSLANFWVHTLSTGATEPLLPSPSGISTYASEHAYPPHTALATFSPTDHHIAYVHANDLYVLEGPHGSGDGVKEAIRVTVDGSPTTFNGVPDWVYEEEVFSGDSSLWWAPDGSKLAFLSFDEEKVPEYEFPIYNPSPWTPGGLPYPEKTVMRYPKPGYPNPLVTLSVFDLSSYLSSPSRPSTTLNTTALPTLDPRVAALTYHLTFSSPFPADDTIIQEVTWVGADELMVRATDRTGGKERVAHFVVEEGRALKGEGEGEGKEGEIVGKVVRDVDWVKKDGGWVEPGQTIIGISSTLLLHSHSSGVAATTQAKDYPPGYLDIVPSPSGFSHLAYFSPPESNDPVFLTSGHWEIDGGVQGIDVERGLIYFLAALPSTQRHLYSIPLPTTSTFSSLQAGKQSPEKPTLLTSAKENKDGYHRTSFSPFGGFYVLSYEGPDVPWQRLVKVGEEDYDHVLVNNTALVKVDAQFQSAEISYGSVKIAEGVELNTMELRPPLMDLSGRTKYPVLFQVYGGPSSQMVSTQWSRDFHHYLVTSLGFIVVKVDPRGTGFKGRGFKVPVRGKLGKLESEDVVEAARRWSEKDYVDSKRVGIWGWSYGGFLTAKVVETNSSVFSLAMSVAPVTDWKYYDSVYTERYMSTPQLNPVGYRNSSVKEMEGFKNVDFALAHGSGDDNVHYLNTAALLDRFTSAQVRNFRFRMFTDSDHSIQMRGSYWELMRWLSDFLTEKFGEGGRTKQRWKLRDWDESRHHAEDRERERRERERE